MLTPEILEYYERGGETVRLSSGVGRLEFLRTWDILTRILPPPPAVIVDVGGATGVYAGPLAHAGYQVTVVDPVPAHISSAAELPGVAAVLGDVRSLPQGDGTADVVLLMGPLYHLPDPAERALAWREAVRVARAGGLVAGATITRHAPLLDVVARGLFGDREVQAVTLDDLAHGRHVSPPGRPLFTTAYFHAPGEPAREASAAGLTGVRTLAVEGPVWPMADRVADLLDDPVTSAEFLSVLRGLEAEPSLLGASSHLLTFGKS
ncbi:class I SAM-dependent methyltransferase [Actinoplanes sp. NBRC 103695]|uniref:class I SAM-dependent methyltransferase n=1 Tax=Actinoplanes sp. NBRC 103695 TaxID=3032202 RepID=UPI0024A3FBAD|nr:class I SAM-dependent methyltransferase [Actinoplanes sp. NBRC 103695]GLZ00566.1 SAM-dependent methyltransferase [Actinoplanes sp. NBRC 103695]